MPEKINRPLFASERRWFPDPSRSGRDGLVAISDELNTDILLEAYSLGIFPWPFEESPILWFCPQNRGVLDFSDFHISRSLNKFLRNCSWQVSFNRAFSDVLENCANSPRAGQVGTWIIESMKRAYLEFHRAGYAHSIEVWEGEELIGGMYGVYVAGVFSGESMFFKKSNASKVALVHLINLLKSYQLQWMDIQMVTPHLKKLGGKYISRKGFLARLEQEKQRAQVIEFNFKKT